MTWLNLLKPCDDVALVHTCEGLFYAPQIIEIEAVGKKNIEAVGMRFSIKTGLSIPEWHDMKIVPVTDEIRKQSDFIDLAYFFQEEFEWHTVEPEKLKAVAALLGVDKSKV
jgi:hypothetical protein